jgi:histidine phosphotransfer protein HptB
MADVLDQAALDNLLEMVGGDPDFVDELVDTFLEDAPTQLAELRRAILAGDAAEAVRPAHTIKGNAASIGARAVETIGRSMEEQARTGDIDGIGERVTDLEAAIAELRPALDEARARRWAAP